MINASELPPREIPEPPLDDEIAGPEDLVELRLYVAGQTPKSVAALANLKRVCDEFLPGRHHIEVIDLLQHPARARADQIVAIPTLVRKIPEPICKVIGTLSDTQRVLVGLRITPLQSRVSNGLTTQDPPR